MFDLNKFISSGVDIVRFIIVMLVLVFVVLTIVLRLGFILLALLYSTALLLIMVLGILLWLKPKIKDKRHN